MDRHGAPSQSPLGGYWYSGALVPTSGPIYSETGLEVSILDPPTYLPAVPTLVADNVSGHGLIGAASLHLQGGWLNPQSLLMI